MSIFSKVNDLNKIDDSIVDQYYSLEWDWIDNKRVKEKLCLKRDMSQGISPLYEKVYYHPMWIFLSELKSVMSIIRSRAKDINPRDKIDIKISSLEWSNMLHRFNEIIKDCGKFKYKGDTFISISKATGATGCAVITEWDEVRQMMINYITKETNNRRYFKNIKFTI